MRPSFGLILTMVLASCPAMAQQLDAEGLLERGVALRRAGDEIGALELFRQAYELEPSPRAEGQIGLAAKSLRLWVLAERHLQGALATTADPWVEKNRTALVQALELVESNIGSLRVETNAPHAKLVVNGRELADLPMTDALRVVAGATDLEVRAPGFQTEYRRETLPARRVTIVRVQLQRDEPAPRAAPRPASRAPAHSPPTRDAHRAPRARPQRSWALGVGAVGVVGLGVGTYFGLRTLSLKSQRDDVCPDVECTTERGIELDQNARDSALISTLSFGVGAAALGAATILWLTAPEPDRAGLMAGAALGPKDASATLRLRF